MTRDIRGAARELRRAIEAAREHTDLLDGPGYGQKIREASDNLAPLLRDEVRHVYMLDGDEVTFDELRALGRSVGLEGVDGDEDENTVTYHYTRID